MTWEEAKDQIAKQHGFDNFEECCFFGLETSVRDILKYLDEAAKLYAREKADRAFTYGIDSYWSTDLNAKAECMRQLFPEK